MNNKKKLKSIIKRSNIRDTYKMYMQNKRQHIKSLISVLAMINKENSYDWYRKMKVLENYIGKLNLNNIQKILAMEKDPQTFMVGYLAKHEKNDAYSLAILEERAQMIESPMMRKNTISRIKNHPNYKGNAGLILEKLKGEEAESSL